MADDRDPDGPAPSSTDGPGASGGEAPSGASGGGASGSGASVSGASGSGASGPDAGAAGRQEPDQTREFDPFADDEEAPAAAGADPDRTAQMPAADGDRTPPSGGETAPMPAVDDTRPMPGADETRRMPGADETGPMPAVDETAPVPTTPAAWSGRAGVPPPKATVVRGPAPTEWAPPEDGGGRWWMPILLGIVALLLLGGLIAGVWLIYNANKVETDPTSTPSLTLAPTSAPTTSPPAPPTTAPAAVPVPQLVGLTDEDARDELDRLGLTYRLVYRPAAEAPGTVIETDPAEGETVPAGTEVTLVIASPLTPTGAPPTAVEPTPTP